MKYTDIGYIDIEDTDLANLSVLFGGRGLGKTYSVLKHRIEAALKNDKIAMVQWCINSGQIDEEVTKKCIKLLEKIKKELR